MIRALAIETSGRIGSVALAQDGALAGQETFEHGLQHAARMIPAIDQLCRSAGWTAKDIAEIYVSAGPGSFTGLRIGITLAKTLAFATGAKVVAVPSVRVLVENAPAEAERVIIVLDAKRDQIFTAAFERPPAFSSSPVCTSGASSFNEIIPAHLGSLADMLARTSRPVYLLGDGIPFHQKFIPSDDPGSLIIPPEQWRARADAVVKIGWAMARANEFVDPLKLVPIYIRRPEAEEKLDSRYTSPP